MPQLCAGRAVKNQAAFRRAACLEWLQLSSGLPSATNPPECGCWLVCPLRRPFLSTVPLTAGCDGARQQKLLGWERPISFPTPSSFILLTLAETKVMAMMCVCLNFMLSLSWGCANPSSVCPDPKPQPAGKRPCFPHPAVPSGRPRAAPLREGCHRVWLPVYFFSAEDCTSLKNNFSVFLFCFVCIGVLV